MHPFVLGIHGHGLLLKTHLILEVQLNEEFWVSAKVVFFAGNFK